MSNIHDINGPSQLFRRYLCPGSAQQERSFYPDTMDKSEDEDDKPEKIDADARRGDILHALTTRLVKQKDEPGPYDIKEDIPDDDKNAVVETASTVRELRKPYVEKGGFEIHEHRLDLSHLGILLGGTIDYGVIAGTCALFVDYKYGSHYVAPPRWNWQFKCYASGLVNMFGMTKIESVKIQPFLYEEDRVQSHEFDMEELREAERQIVAIIKATEEKNAPLAPGTEQCHYCRARDICPARRQVVASMPMHLQIPEFLKNASPQDRGELYSRLLIAGDWIKKAIDTCTYYALGENMSFNGWTKGEGRKSRGWSEPDNVLGKLKSLAIDHGKDPELMEKREVVSVSDAEKILGKSKAMKEKMSSLVTTFPGKAKLVPIKRGK